MSLKIDEQIVDYKNNAWGYNSMTPKYITFHNTSNNASAQNERDYVQNVVSVSNGGVATYHYAVDDKEAIQLLPTNVNGWHAGDGNNGDGNRKSIGVEVCYTLTSKSGFDENKYKKSESNAIELIVKLLKEFNLTSDDVYLHNHWSGKNCPIHTIDEHDNSPSQTIDWLRGELDKKMKTDKDDKDEKKENTSSKKEYVYSDYDERGQITFTAETKVFESLDDAIAYVNPVATYFKGEKLGEYDENGKLQGGYRHVYLTKYKKDDKKAFSYVRYNRSKGGYGYLAYQNLQTKTKVGTIK